MFNSGLNTGNQKKFEENYLESEDPEIWYVELSEIIDVPSIQSLMNDFYKLVNIPIRLNDLRGNILIGVGWQDICTKFHWVHPEACKQSVESNKKLSKGLVPGEFSLYKCKNNMWEIATPITIGNLHIGYIFAGQFFFDDESLDYELFRKQARKYGFNEEKYIEALNKVPRLSRDNVEKGMSFFRTFANMISQLSYSNIKLAKSLSERNALVNALLESEKRDRARSDEMAAFLDTTPAFMLITHDSKALKMKGNRLSYEWLKLPIDTNLSKAAPEGERPETYKLFKDGVEIPLEDMPLRKAASGKELHNYEFDIVYVDGTIRHLLGDAKPLTDDQGNTNGAVAAFIDITKRKEAEEKLRLSESKYRHIIETACEGIWLMDSNNLTIFVNQKTSEMLGYSNDEIIGKRPHQFLAPEYHDIIDERLIKRIRDNLTFDIRFIRKDGADLWCILSTSSLFDDEAKYIGSLGMLTDITERKKMEKALKKANATLEEHVKGRTAELEKAYYLLKESEEKYRNIVETANEGIGLIDNEFKITYANKRMANMLGYVPEEGIGRPIWDFLSEESKAIVKLNMENNFVGIDGNYELKLIRRDGSPLWTHMNSRALFDKEGKYMGSISMFTDVTKRKEAEEALANIEIARQKEIHHRIKNNLQVISSLLDLQADKFRNKKNIKNSEVLEAFRESQDRVISMALIHEELYRGGGLEKLNFSPYVEELSNNLLKTYSIGTKNINLKLILDNNEFFDMDVAVPLGMIINELVSNSFKYAFKGREKGEIQIKLYREEIGSYLKSFDEKNTNTTFTLTISDNGVGIPANLDIKELDSLGLQLVTSLVAQLDGKLEIRRNNGTEFIIRFTLAEKNNQMSQTDNPVFNFPNKM